MSLLPNPCHPLPQEILQSKQQIFLGDLKRSLSEMRGDASKRISDYQREISSAEKEVAAAEKKLSKTKEQAASSEPRKKNRIEGFELDSLLFNAASRIPLVGNSSKERGDKSRDSEDSPGGAKDSTKDDVRSLLRAISYRDQVLKASRRALQKLDRECKKAMFYTLRKVVDKEKEHVELKKLVVDKFDSNIKGVDVVSDMDDFIVAHADEGGELVYSAQALSLLTDLFQPPPPPMVEETSRSRQPSISGGAVSPTRTPQSSPPAASNRKVLSGLPSTPPAAASHPIPAPPAFEFTGYLSQIFYTEVEATNAEIVDRPTLASLSSDSGHAPAHSKSTPSSEEDDGSVKHAHRKARVTNMDVKYRDIANQTEQQLLSLEANKALHEATLWLCDAVKTLAGREAFIAELNQFRSRKVNLGAGFEALAIVLWTSLSYCQVENDIRTAKVIMMLSQTFYRKIEGNRGRLDSEEADEEEDEAGRRGSQYRQYIKEKLMGHAIWQDGNFWEQTLWQCALEQVSFHSLCFLIVLTLRSCRPFPTRSPGMTWTRTVARNPFAECTRYYSARSWR